MDNGHGQGRKPVHELIFIRNIDPLEKSTFMCLSVIYLLLLLYFFTITLSDAIGGNCKGFVSKIKLNRE